MTRDWDSCSSAFLSARRREPELSLFASDSSCASTSDPHFVFESSNACFPVINEESFFDLPLDTASFSTNDLTPASPSIYTTDDWIFQPALEAPSIDDVSTVFNHGYSTYASFSELPARNMTPPTQSYSFSHLLGVSGDRDNSTRGGSVLPSHSPHFSVDGLESVPTADSTPSVPLLVSNHSLQPSQEGRMQIQPAPSSQCSTCGQKFGSKSRLL